MKNSFTNAFVRQMGRELAHDTYREIRSYGSNVKSVDSNPIAADFFAIRLIANAILGFLLPFLYIFPLVRGIKRFTRKTADAKVLVTKSNYKEDRRYRGGIKYLGDSQAWIDITVDKTELAQDELDKIERYGAIEILYASAMIILWIAFAITQGIF